MSNKVYNYGQCKICNVPLEEKFIKYDFWFRGNLIVVENVPAGVCPQCGEKIITAEVGRRLEALLQNAEQIAQAPRIAVPVVRFAAEAESAVA